MIVVRIRKNTKKSSSARVPELEALYRLRDFPEYEDMDFVVHEPSNAAQEMVAQARSDHKAEFLSAREPEKEHVATASQEAHSVPRITVLEDDVVIHIQESPSHWRPI